MSRRHTRTCGSTAEDDDPGITTGRINRAETRFTVAMTDYTGYGDHFCLLYLLEELAKTQVPAISAYRRAVNASVENQVKTKKENRGRGEPRKICPVKVTTLLRLVYLQYCPHRFFLLLVSFLPLRKNFSGGKSWPI